MSKRLLSICPVASRQKKKFASQQQQQQTDIVKAFIERANSETRNAALNLLKFALGAIGKKLIYDTTENLIFGNLGSRFLRCQKFKQRKNGNSPFHRFILLKLCKQIGGTNYQPILAANEAQHLRVGVPYWRGWGPVHISCLMQTPTTRWLCGCVSSFNYRRLCPFLHLIYFHHFNAFNVQ